jgi:hypothetical protein
MQTTSLTTRVKPQALISVSLLLIGCLAAWKISEWIAAGDLTSVIYAGLGIAVCAFVVSILKDWRKGLYVFVVWLLFEDFVRKYMGNNMVVYFAKDLLAAIVYFSFLAAIRQGRVALARFPFLPFVALFFWLAAFQCFNPNAPSLLYSLLGLKLYFFYMPLAFVGFALIRADADLRRFLVISASLAAVIALLGIVQSVLGSSFLNPPVLDQNIQELSTLQRYAPISGAIIYQPNSVFVSAGRFDGYLLLAWVLELGGAGYLLLKRGRRNTVVFVCLAFVAVGSVMGGGRGTLAYVLGSSLVLVGAFLWGAPWRRKQTDRVFRVIQRTAIAVGISLLIALLLFPEAIRARWSYYLETMLPSSPAEQLTGRLESYPIQQFEKAFEQGSWLWGHGIGTTSLGVQYVSRWIGQGRPPWGVESGYGNIVLEFGILGLFLWLLWTGALLIYAFQIVKKLRDTAYFPLAFAIWWFALLILYPMTYGTLNSYQDYVYNAYLWLLIGILYRLPVLASQPAEVPNFQVSSAHES